MRKPDLQPLRQRLLRSGVAPRHVQRMVRELEDHYCDLVERAGKDGVSAQEAHSDAAARLGTADDIVAAALACPELRSWAYRYPRIALVVYPLACLAALPALPVVASVDNAPKLARWGMSALLASLVTATMLLVLQLSIALG